MVEHFLNVFLKFPSFMTITKLARLAFTWCIYMAIQYIIGMHIINYLSMSSYTHSKPFLKSLNCSEYRALNI